MKRIIVMAVSLYLILPVANTLAVNNYMAGLFDTEGVINNHNFPVEVIDNNLTSNVLYTSTVGLPGAWKVAFNKPVDLNGFFLKYEGSNFGLNIVYLNSNGSETETYLNPNKNGYTEINRKNVTSVEFIKYTGNSYRIYEFDLFGELSIEEIIRSPITNLSEVHNHESIKLTWQNPNDENYAGAEIKKDGVVIGEVLESINTYTIKDLPPATKHKLEVISKYRDGGVGSPVTIEVVTDKIPKPSGEVIELIAETEHDRVDLSWKLPDSENFKHVIIYRDTINKTFFDKMFGVKIVKAATPIFETNGTYFNDLTVEPETKYEYTLTTMSTEKIESEGVTVQVTTPKEPDPVIEDGGFEKDPEKGDYTYTWTKPTTGEVKVMVGGKLYKTVPASDGKIIIPAADMKFTMFGKPNVELIPVRADGTEGKPVSPPVSGGGGEGGTGAGMKEIELPFKLNDLVLTTFQIIGLLAGIILIALAIQLVPRLIEIIKKSIQNGRTVRK